MEAKNRSDRERWRLVFLGVVAGVVLSGLALTAAFTLLERAPREVKCVCNFPKPKPAKPARVPVPVPVPVPFPDLPPLPFGTR